MNWLSWENAGLIETGVVFGLVILFALWDLYKTRRAMRGDHERGDQ